MAAVETGERPSVRRLMIMNMQLENFKSYAGVQKIGPFHKKFSAIVGPNGSGKSNVIDAMLFVFGKKAKQIRLDKISSLIHKSDAHPNLREGKVTVYFQEIIDYEDSDDAFDPILGTELSVSRTCNSDGQSHYYINNQKSTYAKVTTLLREKGIDLDHNRFLILQGEVEQISLMKPKAPNEHEDGLLEYIEDIVGTQHYKPKIEEGTAAVEKLSEERETHLNRVINAEKDREALDGAKREAEEFLRIEVKLSKQRAIFIQMKLNSLKDDLKEKQAAVEKLEKNLELECAKTKDAKDELAEIEEELKQEKKEYEKMSKEHDKLQGEFRKLDTNSAENQANKKHAQQTYNRLKAAHTKAVAEVTKTEVQIKTSEKEFKEGQAELEKLRTDIEKDTVEVDAKTDGMQQKLKPLRERYERMQQEILPYNEEVTMAEERVKLAENEKGLSKQQGNDIQIRLEAEQRRKANTGSKISTLEEALAKDRKELKSRKEELEADQKKLDKAEQTLPIVKEKEQDLLAKVEVRKRQIQDAGAENAVVKALKRLKQQGGLDGYYGRLGDLGTIDDQYSTAVGTGAGGNLNCLVVDKESTAKKILQYLKDNSIGRAAVVLLDHQEQQYGQKVKEKFSAPGGLPRLFDLITPCHEKFAPAFYHAVRNTLVSKNIEEATEIAFNKKNGNPRIVTIAGELIEPTGTMTGGGRAPQSGVGMRSYQISPELKEDLLKKQEEEQHQLEQVHSDVRMLNQTIYKLKDKVQQSASRVKEYETIVRSREAELKHAKEEVEAIDKALEDITGEMKEVDKAKKKESAKHKNIENECKEAAKALEAARFKRKDLQDQLQLLQVEMDDVGGKSYTKLKNTIKANKDRVAVLEKKVSEAEATFTACRKHLEGRQKKVTAAEKDADKAKEALAKFEEEEDEDEKLAGVKGELKDKKKMMDAAKKKVDALEKKREQKKDTLNKSKGAEVKIQHEFKAADAELKGVTGQQTKLNDTLDNINKAIRKSIVEYGIGILEPSEVEDPTTFEPESYTVIVSEGELEEFDPTNVKRLIQRLEETQKKLKPNVKALSEWQEKDRICAKREEELKVVSDKRTEAQSKVELLRKARHDEFMAGFKAITFKLKEMYQMLTLGGDAELELVDTFDPFTEGLQFSVRPPKKSWKHISNLSGGEKTLSSLALVFALHHFKPTPVYVMDEIDAALDFKNVSIVANYVKSAASNAQFIIISLRNNMFELANRLIGICKTENCTKSVAINPASFAGLLPSTPAQEQVGQGLSVGAKRRMEHPAPSPAKRRAKSPEIHDEE
eukprot:TRINITY_DN5360_c0_g1_i1.p1 TRINITY_DN5360_c0_g1~~TRINITY_DN5360_c0_g1_i1.p1  ORF type:complete len:1304 (+),score=699.93 TRINITY_DN5360_c0_g1_i1:30-3914(+)